MCPSFARVACLVSLVCLVGCSRDLAPADDPPEFTLTRAGASVPAPVALTATDGTGLVLEELRVQVVLQTSLAFTQLEFAFKNPEPRRLEGRLEFVLPEAASISRLALSAGDHYLDGELVERPRAVQAYEEALHGRRDPALLEHDAGNEYRLRVFPIEAHETKRVLVSYSQVLLGSDETYRLLLAGLPEVAHVRVELHGPNFAGVFERQRWKPSGDLQVSLPSALRCAAVNSDGLALVPVTAASASNETSFSRLSVLLDTSASNAQHFAQRLDRLADLLTALTKQRGAPFPVQLIVFDQEVVPLLALRSDQFGPALRAQLLARGALGATDLARGLRELGKLAKLGERVLVYSDGIATAGATEAATLSMHAGELAKAGVERLDVLADRRESDGATLTALAHSELPEAGVIVWDDEPNVSAKRMLLGTERRVPLNVARAEWTFPSELRGVEPERVYAVFAKFAGAIPAHVQVGDQRLPTCLLDALHGDLLSHAWARTQIAYLQQKQAGLSKTDRERVEQRILALSGRHRVLSEYTAWVVLESEQDYQRHGIERGAPHLMVQAGRLVLSAEPQPLDEWLLVEPWLGAARDAPLDAGAPEPLATLKAAEGGPRKRDVPVPIGLAAGPGAIASGDASAVAAMSGPGVHGTASSAYGADSAFGFNALGGALMGDGFRGRSARVPDVRSSVFDVRGALDREVVRRVIMRHINEVRFCYEQQLAWTPDLRGRVELRFVISTEGAVGAAKISGSTLNDTTGERCIEVALKRWTFPRPADGKVVAIRHGFAFSPVRSAERGPEEPLVRFSQRQREARVQAARERAWQERPRPSLADALEGPLLEVSALIEAGAHDEALALARTTQHRAPHDVTALLALARAALAAGDPVLAARAYGSLIDLFPSRAELRRAAGEGLESIARAPDGDALALAIDSYRKAKALRPDQPSSYRLLALALLRAGEREAARNELAESDTRNWTWNRFQGVLGVLASDRSLATQNSNEPFVRICLYWENDATDVDLHVYDGVHRHVGNRADTDETGPHLSADIATGFGPECVTARGSEIAYPYLLQAHYAQRGAMGHAIGAAHILQVEASGRATFAMRPFVIMKDQAYVALGQVREPG
jgi:Flp pilus assembly protein TadD